MKNEIWKDVPNYEGLYQVSNYGRLKSLEKSVKFYSGYAKKKCERKYPERIICKNHIANGYLQLELYKNGKAKKIKMHRLVAETFIPNPNNYPCVNHKDENKLNNCVDNLEWCTYSYNNSYNNCHIRRGKTQKGKSKTLITYNGETKTISEWAKIYNISYYAMRYRIKKYKDKYEMIFK